VLGSPEDVVSNYLSAEVIGHKSLNPIPNTSLYGLIWLSTTFYNKSLCVEVVCWLFRLFHRQKPHAFWGRDSEIYEKSLEMRHFAFLRSEEPELALFPGRSNRWG